MTIFSLAFYLYFKNLDARNITIAIFGSSLLVAIISLLTYFYEKQNFYIKLVYDLRKVYNYIDDFLLNCAISKSQFEHYFELYDKIEHYDFILYKETTNSFFLKCKASKIVIESAELLFTIRSKIFNNKKTIIGLYNALNENFKSFQVEFPHESNKTDIIEKIHQDSLKELKEYLCDVRNVSLLEMINKIEKKARLKYQFDSWQINNDDEKLNETKV